MPVRVRCSATSVVSSMPAPASSTNDAAICVTAKSRRRRLVPEVDAGAAGEWPRLTVLAPSAVGSFGHEGEQHGGDHGQRRADPQQRGVDGDVEGPHRDSGPHSVTARRPSGGR